MSTLDTFKKATQRLARLERKQTLYKIKQRKQETRRKIQLGGLIVKAHLDGYSKDIILGALLDAKQQLESDEVKRLFQIKGQQAFLEQESINEQSGSDQ